MTGTAQTTEFVESHDGIKIALHHLGGDGPPLVVCHATGFCGQAYRPMVAGLTQVFSVWAIDFRGHGASQITAQATMVWEDYARDLLAAVGHLGGGPVPAIGHSLGGATTLFAEVLQPRTFSAAWLFEPIVFPPVFLHKPSVMAAAAERRRAEFDSRAEALARYASRPPLNLLRADSLASYVEHGFIDTDTGTVRLACRPHHEAMTFANAGVVTTELVASVQMPVVIAAGTDDPDDAAAAFAPPAATALPNGELALFDHMGHFGPLQSPNRIAAAAVEFFARVGVIPPPSE